MRRDYKTGEKVWYSGKEATVLCCSGNQVLIHTMVKSVFWIKLEQIDTLPKAVV